MSGTQSSPGQAPTGTGGSGAPPRGPWRGVGGTAAGAPQLLLRALAGCWARVARSVPVSRPPFPQAQLIAQSIGQAFSVAYQEFLRANGINPEDLSQKEYSDVISTQEMYNDDLVHFSKSENCKEVSACHRPPSTWPRPGAARRVPRPRPGDGTREHGSVGRTQVTAPTARCPCMWVSPPRGAERLREAPE